MVMNFRSSVPLRNLVVLLQHFDQIITSLRAEENADQSVAMIGTIDHERFHFLITDPIMQFFDLGVAKTKLRHQLCQAFAEYFIALEFG
jgi:hypothetical protein